MKINLRKNYRYLLVISIALIIIGIILKALFDTTEDFFNDPIYKFIMEMPWFIVVFFVVIFAPITEEIAFRSWTCKKRYWKWISFAVSTIFVAVTNIYIGIAYGLVFLSIILLLKNKPKLQLFSFLIITSLTFASLHYGNLQPKSFLLAFPQYLGVGLFLAFLALRFNLLTSILVHALNNGIALFALGLFSPVEKPIKLENTTYKATLTNLSYKFKFDQHSSAALHGDFIEMYNYKVSSMIESLIEENDSIYYIKQDEVISFKKYNLYAKQKDTTKLINQKELILDLCKLKNIKVDTIQEKREVYLLNIRDWKKVISKEKDFDTINPLMISTMFGLCNMITNSYLISTGSSTQYVIPDKNIQNKTIVFDYNLISYERTFEQIRKSLDSAYSITLRKKDTIVNVIRIRNK